MGSGKLHRRTEPWSLGFHGGLDWARLVVNLNRGDMKLVEESREDSRRRLAVREKAGEEAQQEARRRGSPGSDGGDPSRVG